MSGGSGSGDDQAMMQRRLRDVLQRAKSIIIVQRGAVGAAPADAQPTPTSSRAAVTALMAAGDASAQQLARDLVDLYGELKAQQDDIETLLIAGDDGPASPTGSAPQPVSVGTIAGAQAQAPGPPAQVPLQAQQPSAQPSPAARASAVFPTGFDLRTLLGDELLADLEEFEHIDTAATMSEGDDDDDDGGDGEDGDDGTEGDTLDGSGEAAAALPAQAPAPEHGAESPKRVSQDAPAGAAAAAAGAAVGGRASPRTSPRSPAGGLASRPSRRRVAGRGARPPSLRLGGAVDEVVTQLHNVARLLRQLSSQERQRSSLRLAGQTQSAQTTVGARDALERAFTPPSLVVASSPAQLALASPTSPASSTADDTRTENVEAPMSFAAMQPVGMPMFAPGSMQQPATPSTAPGSAQAGEMRHFASFSMSTISVPVTPQATPALALAHLRSQVSVDAVVIAGVGEQRRQQRASRDSSTDTEDDDDDVIRTPSPTLASAHDITAPPPAQPQQQQKQNDAKCCCVTM